VNVPGSVEGDLIVNNTWQGHLRLRPGGLPLASVMGPLFCPIYPAVGGLALSASLIAGIG